MLRWDLQRLKIRTSMKSAQHIFTSMYSTDVTEDRHRWGMVAFLDASHTITHEIIKFYVVALLVDRRGYRATYIYLLWLGYATINIKSGMLDSP